MVDSREVDDSVFLSIFTGQDFTAEGNLEELLDGMVSQAYARVDDLNAVKDKIMTYEKVLAESQVPDDLDDDSD
jgi:hypothetical protein|tara:strand:+ start:553 stop:774 length:222 start_codon:yes stop_codon:yes gene_type:complete